MSNGVQQVAKNVGRVLQLNSPTILTGLSVAGVFTTAFLAIDATPKAIRLIEEERDERYPCGGELTKIEVIQTTWRCYIPALIMGIVTSGCVIGANSINLRRNAALASVYSLTEATLKEYQSKVVETIGANKEGKIRDEIAQDRITNDPVSRKEVIITGGGDTLCYDKLSGRYFKSDIEKIRRVQNQFNKALITNIWMSVNDFYCELGLEDIELGEQMGWCVDELMEIDFRSMLSSEGIPCLVIEFKVRPKYEDKTIRY